MRHSLLARATADQYILTVELYTVSATSVKNYTGQTTIGESQTLNANVAGNLLTLSQPETFTWALETGVILALATGLVLLLVLRRRSSRFTYSVSGDKDETVVY